MVTKFSLLFFWLFSLCVTIHAGNLLQTIRGQIIEKNTKEPLPGANVVVYSDDKQYGASTNESGTFVIEKVPVGRWNITATMIGFHSYTSNNVLVYSGKETVLEIVMEENISLLDEVVVLVKTDKEQPLNKMATVSARMLSSEEANRYAGSWGDPSRMVANLAGVAAANDSRNDIVVRGNSPMGLLWRLDGFEIPNPNHFGAMGGTGGPIGMLNNNQLANSDFYTGAFPAEFGNVTSGIFDLRLRNGNDSRHEFLASMGFNGAELGAEGPLNKHGTSYMVNARYSFLSILDAMGFQIAGTDGAVPTYQDMCSKVNIPLKTGTISWVTLLGANQIHSVSDFEDDTEWTPGDQGSDMEAKGKQLFTGMNYMHRFSRNTRLENRLSYQYFESKIDQYKLNYPDGEKTPGYKGTSAEGRGSWHANLHHRINSRHFFTSGTGIDLYMTDLNTTDKDIVLNNYRKNSALINGFVQWQYRLNENITFTPGVYGQYYTLSRDYSIEPRLGMKMKITPRTALSLGTGLYSQLQPRQVYFYEVDGELVNKSLEMSKSWQSVIGYDFKISNNLRLKTEVFYQHLYHIPVIPDLPAESILNFGDDYENDWNYIFQNKGKGRNYGLELTLERFFNNNYYFLVTASLYDSRYKGYDEIERHTKFAGNHTLNTLFGYEWKLKKGRLLSLNAKVSWMGGKRYLPMSMEHEGGDIMYDYTQAYSEHLPDYFRCDLNFNMKKNYRKFSLEWFVELNNITNHKNLWIKYYNANRGQEEKIYQYSFMPIGGCKLYFQSSRKK